MAAVIALMLLCLKMSMDLRSLKVAESAIVEDLKGTDLKVKEAPVRRSVKLQVGVVTCLTSKNARQVPLAETAVARLLIPSLGRTAELGMYNYVLYVGIDDDDPVWTLPQAIAFLTIKGSEINMRIVVKQFQSPKNHIPMNEILKVAYDEGCTYFVRVNDDTEFVTDNWTSLGVAALGAFDPPNVGVVGPTCHEGNVAILTHDMTHRTHMDIFKGEYYADEFDNWWLDDWISKVYGEKRTRKLASWTVKHHTSAHGTRYEVAHHKQKLLAREISRGVAKIEKWLDTGARYYIKYGGETWHTPSKWKITPVVHGTVSLPSGQVSNRSGVYGFQKWYWTSSSKPIVRPHILTSPVLSLVQIWNDCFQHIAFDTLPKLMFVCPFLLKASEIQVAVMNTLQRDLVLEACPCNPDRFVVVHSPFTSPIVYVPYFVGEFKMGIVPPNFMQPLNSQTTPGTDVVYLARKRTTTRSVDNEADVISTLTKRWPNVRVVYPTNDWRRDRYSVRNASVIIGPHGGALGNMIFAPPNATVVEFLPLVKLKRAGKNERPCYFGLAHALGFSYHAVEPSRFSFEGDSMVVPTMQLESVLNHIKTPNVCTHIVTDSNAGLFSNMMGVLAAMAKYGTNIEVQWGNTMYRAPHSKNVWTQYFEIISNCTVGVSSKRIQLSGWDHGFADAEKMLAPMARRIRLNFEMQKEFNKLWRWRNNNTLGVHVRATDRATDKVGHELNLFVIPTQRYIDRIQQYLAEHPDTKTVFVASDSQRTLDELVEVFGNRIQALDIKRSTDTRSIHHGRLDTPFSSGQSAVLDAWLLSTTNYKILSASQLSLFAVLRQGFGTPFFSLNEGDGYLRTRAMFPSRPHKILGAFPTPVQNQLSQRHNAFPWIVLLTVNSGFVDFFYNWWNYYKQLGIKDVSVVVVAEDNDVYAKLKATLSITIERSTLAKRGAHAWDTDDYKKMVSTRPDHVLRHLNAGKNVLYTDVDTVWLRNPFTFLSKTADIIASVDSQSYKGMSPYYCTGFMAVINTPKTRALFKSWQKKLQEEPQLNQPLFNRLLHNYNKLHHVALPNKLFPNGLYYFTKMGQKERRNVVVIHNNFIIGHEAKRNRFKNAGLWKKQSQALYDEQTMEVFP